MRKQKDKFYRSSLYAFKVKILKVLLFMGTIGIFLLLYRALSEKRGLFRTFRSNSSRSGRSAKNSIIENKKASSPTANQTLIKKITKIKRRSSEKISDFFDVGQRVKMAEWQQVDSYNRITALEFDKNTVLAITCLNYPYSLVGYLYDKRHPTAKSSYDLFFSNDPCHSLQIIELKKGWIVVDYSGISFLKLGTYDGKNITWKLTTPSDHSHYNWPKIAASNEKNTSLITYVNYNPSPINQATLINSNTCSIVKSDFTFELFNGTGAYSAGLFSKESGDYMVLVRTISPLSLKAQQLDPDGNDIFAKPPFNVTTLNCDDFYFTAGVGLQNDSCAIGFLGKCNGRDKYDFYFNCFDSNNKRINKNVIQVNEDSSFGRKAPNLVRYKDKKGNDKLIAISVTEWGDIKMRFYDPKNCAPLTGEMTLDSAAVVSNIYLVKSLTDGLLLIDTEHVDHTHYYMRLFIEKDLSAATSLDPKWLFLGIGGGLTFLAYLTIKYGAISFYFIYRRLKTANVSNNKIELKNCVTPDLDLLKKEFANETVKFADMKILKKLGSGSGGIVYRAKWNGVPIAFKVFTISCKVDQEQFTKEVKIMLDQRHPNVIASYGVTVRDCRYGLVMELAENGSLHDVLTKQSGDLAPEIKYNFFVGIINGLKYLHDQKIIHRDLKSHNILITKDWTAKITDFGLSREYVDKTKTMTSRVGTFQWMSPSYRMDEKGNYQPEDDLYSMAAIFWEILNGGKEPFENFNTKFVIPQKVYNGTLKLGFSGIPDVFKNLFEKLADPKRENRPSLEKCREIFANESNKKILLEYFKAKILKPPTKILEQIWSERNIQDKNAKPKVIPKSDIHLQIKQNK